MVILINYQNKAYYAAKVIDGHIHQLRMERMYYKIRKRITEYY